MKQGRVDPLDIVLHEVHNVKETRVLFVKWVKKRRKRKKEHFLQNKKVIKESTFISIVVVS